MVNAEKWAKGEGKTQTLLIQARAFTHFSNPQVARADAVPFALCPSPNTIQIQ
jgi:hypothetical protein